MRSTELEADVAAFGGFAHSEFFVQTDWVAARLGQPDLRIIDCTVHIVFDPVVMYTITSAREDFVRRHIPGAQFVDVVTELSDAANLVPLMAPSAAQFASVIGALGVGNDSQVVLYSAENPYWATRVWWLFRLFGFDGASVLDGGWQKWRREGRPVETGAARPPNPAHFAVREQRPLMAAKADVLAAIGDASVCTINALPEDQYHFTSGIHYGRPGRIAGSVNIPSESLFDPETNLLLPATELRRRFERVGAFDKRVITYCGGGIAASADAMALVMLGHSEVTLYDGSLCEWAADPGLLMEVDPVPRSTDQAVAAIENSRLMQELQDGLAREAAMSEVLRVINASPGDLAPVFDAVIDNAMRLCEASHGYLYVYNGGLIEAVALRGSQEFVDWQRRRGAHRINPGTPVERSLRGEPLIHIADAMAEDLYRTSPAFKELIDRSGIRTGVTVALRKDSVFLGTINVYRREVRPFSDKQIALLRNFAAQAVIAMENARLLTETREALEQQTATAEVLQVINSSPGDLAPVFDAIIERARRLCEPALGVMLTWDGERYHRVAWGGASDEIIEATRAPVTPLPGSPGYRTVHGEDVVSIADLAAEESLRPVPAMQTWVRLGVRSYLSVALRKDDRLLGALVIYRLELRPFAEKDIALLQNFAAQAVIAMENARLLGELRQRTEEVAELNRGLEARVAEQVEELGRVGRLKRFLAPQLAELIVSQGDEKILESHRREIVVVFCDLRGYTAFTETAEPEEVLNFLREYHGALGPLVSQFEGTLDQFSGDGIMVFFNDPVPIPDPAERAVNMAVAMREAAAMLIAHWRERGRELGFGAGIAQGYATLGQIGFSERSGYTAIGTVCNVAARLCAEAKDGQILLSQRVNAALKGSVATEQVGALALKGLTQPVVAYNVPLAASQPALRVIEGGPPSV